MKKIVITGLCLGLVSAGAFAAKKPSPQVQLALLQKEMRHLQQEIGTLEKEVTLHKKSTKIVARPTAASHQVFGNSVVTAPFTERSNYYNGSQLLVNAPSINEDVALLERHQAERAYLKSKGASLPQHPRLVLSGKVQAKANVVEPYSGNTSSDINLSDAELDLFAEITPLVNGFFNMTYEDGLKHSSSDITNQRRMNNSRIKLDRGFITLGDFSRSSFYASAGQMNMPFGRYSSSMISDPLTHFGKTKARGLLFGYAPHHAWTVTPHAELFAFKGDTKYGNTNIVKEGGVDAGIDFAKGKVNANLGASYLTNVAESNDLQGDMSTSTNKFQGFSENSGTERIRHAVGATDIYGHIGYASFNLLGEFITTVREFNQADLSFNTRGAKPHAYNVEGSYGFHVFKRPASFAVGYTRSYEALALAIPEQRYVAAFQITPIKNTSAKIEFAHNIDYDRGDIATGAGKSENISGTGHSSNAVTAKFAVYF